MAASTDLSRVHAVIRMLLPTVVRFHPGGTENKLRYVQKRRRRQFKVSSQSFFRRIFHDQLISINPPLEAGAKLAGSVLLTDVDGKEV
jgi:hypothetical protein